MIEDIRNAIYMHDQVNQYLRLIVSSEISEEYEWDDVWM